MKRILYIRSSLFGNDSASSQLAGELVDQLMAEQPGSKLTTLDLAQQPLPHLDAGEFSSWLAPENERTREQRQQASLSDHLIDQLQDHDTLVLAVPMYNMGIPSTLKAWIDRVARAGKTFRYTASGPEGLVTNMQAYLVFARGGMYCDTAADTQTGHLKNILGLMGIVDVETVFAEGLNMGNDQRTAAFDDARHAIQILAGTPVQEANYAFA